MSAESSPTNSGGQLKENLEESAREPIDEHQPFRILMIKVIVPRRIRQTSTSELELIRSSLGNAIAVCSVYASRIEREYQKRKSLTCTAL